MLVFPISSAKADASIFFMDSPVYATVVSIPRSTSSQTFSRLPLWIALNKGLRFLKP